MGKRLKWRLASLAIPALIALSTASPALASPAPAVTLNPGTVVALSGTPHLWFVGDTGGLHWGGDTRALAEKGINWSNRVEMTLDQLRALPRQDPWLSAGLLKLGDPIFLVKWEANEAIPTLLHIQSIADVELFGINGTNYGAMVLDQATWEQRYGMQASSLARGELPAAGPVPAPAPREEWLNLAGANLAGANRRGADLHNANLYRANLTGADLSGANLSGANLTSATLTKAVLTGADLSRATLRLAIARSADFRQANLCETDMHQADLTGADLTGARLCGAVHLTSANLTSANLRGVDLTSVRLAGASIARADLRNVNLSGVDLAGINLSGANLSGANLSGANLTVANLSGAVLIGANTSGTTFTGANTTGCLGCPSLD
jgi:uncharacterized protein YjbI with pentapeptide repeats